MREALRALPWTKASGCAHLGRARQPPEGHCLWTLKRHLIELAAPEKHSPLFCTYNTLVTRTLAASTGELRASIAQEVVPAVNVQAQADLFKLQRCVLRSVQHRDTTVLNQGNGRHDELGPFDGIKGFGQTNNLFPGFLLSSRRGEPGFQLPKSRPPRPSSEQRVLVAHEPLGVAISSHPGTLSQERKQVLIS